MQEWSMANLFTAHNASALFFPSSWAPPSWSLPLTMSMACWLIKVCCCAANWLGSTAGTTGWGITMAVEDTHMSANTHRQSFPTMPEHQPRAECSLCTPPDIQMHRLHYDTHPSILFPSIVTELLPGIGAIPPAAGIIGMAAGIPIIEGTDW